MAPGRIQGNGNVCVCSHSSHLLCSDPFNLTLKIEDMGVWQEDTEMCLLCVPQGYHGFCFSLLKNMKIFVDLITNQVL